MKILWVTNIALPEASQIMGLPESSYGGWFASTAELLSAEPGISLSVASPKEGTSEVKRLQGQKMTHYIFPVSDSVNALRSILAQTKPDLVHIFGTEYKHSYCIAAACKEENVAAVISLQGLISICGKHYMAELPIKIQNSVTIRDFIKRETLKQMQRKYEERGTWEQKALCDVKHVIGRTTWDEACSMQINSTLHYHKCNETLRDVFYMERWDLDLCERNTLFVSQGGYPLKGLHFLLEAMPMILERIPDAKIYVAGYNPIRSNNFSGRMKQTAYGRYLKELVRNKNLEKKVIFTGNLDKTAMCRQFLKAHVFLSPSVIENESNSLSEARALGLPSVVSYVGGVTERLRHGVDGFFYPYNEPYLLAHYVIRLLTDDLLCKGFSEKAREFALQINNPMENLKTLFSIYQEIMSAERA